MRARLPFFYGWFIVAAGMASAAFMVGTSIFGAGVFAGEMQGELGWSRADLFGALSIRLTGGALLAPFLGAWSDRPGGARMAMVGSALLMIASLAPLRWVDSLPAYYLVYGGVGALASAATGGLLLGIVPKWFTRNRGKAVAAAAAGGALGPLIFPVLNAELIAAVGWRDAWLYLGILAAVVLLPLMLLVHGTPEDIGLLPDGDSHPEPGTATPPRWIERSYTLREVLRTRAFWLLTLAFSMGVMAMNSWQPSWTPYLEDAGFSLRVATRSIFVFGIFSFLGRFIWAPLIKRVPLNVAVLIEMGIAAFAVSILGLISTAPLLFAWSIVYGVAIGGFWLLQPLTLANYFGTRHLGAIRGFNQPFIAVASGIAPISTAAIFDATGSYAGVLIFAAVGAGVGAILGFFAKPPQR
jgi:MFS family permease